MKHHVKLLFLTVWFCGLALSEVFATDLIGVANVSQTSDTAAKAKTEAMDIARRKIIFDVLSNYSEIDSLTQLLDKTPDEDLLRFVSSVSVSDERISSETYSATITMNIDNNVVKRWLTSNDVRNWVPIAENTEMFSVFIVVPNGLSDWAELKRIVHNDKKEMNVVTMVGNQVFVKLPFGYRTKFTAALREAGWRYADNGGVLQVWR